MAHPAHVMKRIISPIERFMEMETAGGITLMIATVIAMFWANSADFHSYEAFIEYPLGLTIGSLSFIKPIEFWVNDGLMVIFFFVVGMEIKRELVSGELSSPKKAALPMFAALGGMIGPALIYASLNHGGVGAHGWGIPMATDIAFAVGVLTLLSKKVPFPLKVFLLALAIADDLGAVLVIAFFYTNQIVGAALGIAAICFILIYFLRIAQVRSYIPYIILGIIAWIAVLQSGVHATISGVIIGFLTPLQAFIPKKEIHTPLNETVKKLNDSLTDHENPRVGEDAEKHLIAITRHTKDSLSPLDRLAKALHPWVTYVIMPLFALVNAGVHIHGVTLSELFHYPVSLGVFLGLFLGKPIGVLIACFLTVKLNIASLPRGVNWFHMVAVGVLAGIGFTMAIFVSNLALDSEELHMYSKLGILLASTTAAIVGVFLLSLNKDVKNS